MDTLESSVIVSEDGFLYDPETGEVLGVADAYPESGLNPEEAERILLRFQRLDAEVSARSSKLARLNTDRDEYARRLLSEDEGYIALTAQIEGVDSLLRRSEGKRKRLGEFYQPVLKEFAQRILSGLRERTWRSESGTALALRKKAATIEILDMDKAVVFAETFGLADKVKKSVNKSDLKDAVLSLEEIPDAFRIIPSDDDLKIDTGVKA